MEIVKFFSRLLGIKKHYRPKTEVKVLHCNSAFVNIGCRYDDSIGMSDYKRSFKIKRGKVRYNIIKHYKKDEQCNFFDTYEFTPITDSAYIMIIEKPLSKSQPMNTKIWNVNLYKKQIGVQFKKLKIF